MCPHRPPQETLVVDRALPPRCPECGAPAKLRTRAPDQEARVGQHYVYSPPLEASDAMIEAITNRLAGWGLVRSEAAEHATRQALNRALQILAKELEYRWL